MIYESSYECGGRPFIPDLKRGYWSKASDFLYAGLSIGFRLDVFALTWIAKVETGVSGFLPAYLVSLASYVVPLLVVKSFLGQFSSSGFISALRLCPLFKGIGYVSLFLNACVLIYYSVFGIIPLVYLFTSFKTILPWSCEGIRKWTQEDVLVSCGMENENRENLCPNVEDDHCEGGCYRSVASSLYFYNLFGKYHFLGLDIHMSWHLALSVLLLWTIIAMVFYRLSSTEKIGQFIRYSVQHIICLLMIFIIRYSFEPGTLAHYKRIFQPNWNDFVSEMSKLPAYGISAFGPGWGLFITLSSFNKFRTNITRSSWIIGIGQMFVIFSLDMLEKFINLHLKSSTEDHYFRQQTQFGSFFLTSGSSLAALEWPNVWCILFYGMLFLATVVLMVIQLHSILTSVFDEFVFLREQKLCCTLYVIAAMAILSLYFSSLSGYESSVNLMLETFISQSLINLLLILLVTWIYGRERFQRDIYFMTSKRFDTFDVYVLRFFAPLCILVVMVQFLHYNHMNFFFEVVVSFLVLFNYVFSSQSTNCFDIFMKLLPWCAIPGSVIYTLYRSQGTLKERLLKCCRPNDWYPVEAEDRLRYEETVNSSNMSHPLTDLKWDDDVFDDQNIEENS
ncbi:sodium-dependent proline transporter-like [Musca vetustissima]|uniref:sodium-dependent proline transporter-like n=1 Tax=Musca vetustissima TaxID=27455 RepID=UPI002AB640E4|nr:sodium-dependent proline transporter-like [Musca vetustissima]